MRPTSIATDSIATDISAQVSLASETPRALVVWGGFGRGSSALVRQVAAQERDRRTVVQVHGRDRRSITGCALPDPERRMLFVVDDFHTIRPDDAGQWLHRIHATPEADHVYLLAASAVHLSEALDGLLRRVPGALHYELPRLSPEQLRSEVEKVAGQRLPTWTDEHFAVAAGLPAAAREIGTALRSQLQNRGEVTSERVGRACRLGILRHVANEIPNLPEDFASVAVLTQLISPHGDAEDAAELLGLGTVRSRAAATQLIGAAMLAAGSAHQALRREVAAWAPQPILSAVAPLGLRFLERMHADPLRLFETHQLLGHRDGSAYFDAARAALEQLADADHRRSRAIAQAVLKRAEEQEVPWAAETLVAVSLAQDWETALAHSGATGSIAARLLRQQASVELCLDSPEFTADTVSAPATAPQLTRALVCGRPVTGADVRRILRNTPDHQRVSLLASSVLVRAIRGWRAEPHLARLLRHLDEAGALNTDPSVAAQVAMACLALSDHDGARAWADITTVTSGRDRLGSVGLGHFVSAMADLREGSLEPAAEQAARCRTAFEQVRAPRLTQFAVGLQLHVELESRTRGTLLPQRVSPGAHPLVATYIDYVLARHAMARGKLEEASQGLFATGRQLSHHHLLNPALMNWRPHLAALFRATDQERLASCVERDLLNDMLAWHRVNPIAASRRAVVLGGATAKLFAAKTQPATPNASEPHQINLEALSQAEVRVVKLVLEGCSNRQAANALFLSKRTVDTHLGNIYRKLGINSREALTQVLSHHPTAFAMLSGCGSVRLLG